VNYAQLLAALARWLWREDLTTALPDFIRLGHTSLRRQLLGVPEFDEPVTDSDTNWLLTQHPDLYLYAALVESAPYLKDDERIALWRAELDRRIAEVRRGRSAAVADLTTYGGLLAAVRSYLDRSDLAGVVPTFIRLGEATMSRRLALQLDSVIDGPNWLFAAHPDLYLYAALVESAPYVGDDPRLAMWQVLLEEGLVTVLTFSTQAAPPRRQICPIG
jgi:hypothetical protein